MVRLCVRCYCPRTSHIQDDGSGPRYASCSGRNGTGCHMNCPGFARDESELTTQDQTVFVQFGID